MLTERDPSPVSFGTPLPSGSVAVGLQVHCKLTGECKVRGMSPVICCHRQ